MPLSPSAASLRILQSGGGSHRAPSQPTAPPAPAPAAVAGSPPAALSPWRGRREPPCTAPTRASNVDGAGGASGSSSSFFVEEGDGNNLSSRWTQLVACSPSAPILDHVGGGCCSSASAPGACSTTPTRPPPLLQHRQANASETRAPQLSPRHSPRPYLSPTPKRASSCVPDGRASASRLSRAGSDCVFCKCLGVCMLIFVQLSSLQSGPICQKVIKIGRAHV